MLLFKRGRALKDIEEGLQWRAGGTGSIPELRKHAPECVFVEVPALTGRDDFHRYLKALSAESERTLGGLQPNWLHLRGEGVCRLPIDGMRAVIQAACPAAAGIGLDVSPAQLEPGDIAGWRSISVERFNFIVDGPFSGIEDPIRRARALGAFASVEVCFGGELAGRTFLQAVERALAASPNQLCVCDERSRGAFGAEFLERAGELCAVAGFRRISLWAWAQGPANFDRLGILLSGRGVGMGPGAAGCSPAYTNPGLNQWLDTRSNGCFEVIQPDSRTEQWLALAAGLYRMELKKDALDCKMHRHVSALERMGVLDKRGIPVPGAPMEFCHRAVRAAKQMLAGGMEPPELQADMQPDAALAVGRKRS